MPRMNWTWPGLVLLCVARLAWAGVDINTAPQSALEAVRGIGPVKARAIIDYRNAHGPFKSVDDLDRVRGFGKATIEKMRSELEVDAVANTPPVIRQEIHWSRTRKPDTCPGCPRRE